MHNKIKMNSVLGKRILSLIRKGDCANSEERNAIDLVFSDITKDKNRSLSSIGYSLGGTVKYLEDNRYGRVTGLDLDAEKIEYTKFIDKINLAEEDIIYLMNKRTKM